MRVSLFQIEVVHTAIFFILSACVLFLLHSAVAGPITVWTWVALGLVTAETIVLALSGWQCPLTVLAERMGAKEPGVADLFLPKWLADRIFPVCGTTFVLSCLLLAWRLASRG